MEQLSIFDIFKIGVGPSSSHTLGPWKAAILFTKDLKDTSIDHIEVHLFGSLSKTGIGHATDIAVQLGLEGFDPKTVETKNIPFYMGRIKANQQITINQKNIPFNPLTAIVFQNYALPEHPNTLTFKAFYKKNIVLETTYYSVGGGFVEQANKIADATTDIKLPYPIEKGKDLLNFTTQTGLPISDIVFQNELTFRSKEDIENNIAELFDTMLECAFKGCQAEGILPGGLNVKRRAKIMNEKLLLSYPIKHKEQFLQATTKEQLFRTYRFENKENWLTMIKKLPTDFNMINKWISCFALAVNEENAALGRVVTSPTNGAAGVIPAVLMYYYCFCANKGLEDIQKFMLVAGEIGCLFKKGATISAAVGGCQAEIGVSSAMAAGGLTEILGGTPEQVLMAAEIAMEHHLGLTCDPIGGLVQIPCIERNTMGAMKAITASNLALSGDPDSAIVNFDVVVKTMWDTAQDMNGKYKETSEGGLAFNMPVMPNC